MTMATLLWAAIAAGSAVVHLIADATDQLDTAILEGMAAITTTSMTGLDADSLPHGLLMFRALMQWVGGLGGLLLVLVVAPLVLRDRSNTQRRRMGTRSRPLITARTRGTQTLVAVYLGFSVLMLVGYVAAGMNAFDAVAHAMATVSTGGLSTRTGSLAAFDAAGVEWVAALGMGVAGLNVGVVWWTLRGEGGNLRHATELRAYLAAGAASVAAVALWLSSDLGGTDAIRSATVAVTSAMSTTGFESLDATLFDNGAQALLIILVGIGAMAGSAGGGFGYSRLLQDFGLARRELRLQLHPTAVDVVRVDGRAIAEKSLDRLTGYVVLLFVTAATGAMLIELGDSSITARSAIVLAITSLSTAGQQTVDPVALGTIGSLSKLTLALLMLLRSSLDFHCGGGRHQRLLATSHPRSTPAADDQVVMTLTRRPVESPTAHVVGLALMFLAPGMVIAAIIEWGESSSDDEFALLVAAGISLVVGSVIHSTTTLGTNLRTVSIFSIVAWTWIVCSIFGALPFVFGSMFSWSEWDSALFESVSGFSCTGSTVLSDIEANGRGVLMWRQMTQWYGGMGMVVLAVTVLPYLGVGGLALMTAEAPGHSSDRLAPRVSETAKRLWLVYCGLTLAIALRALDRPWAQLVRRVRTRSIHGGHRRLLDLQLVGRPLRLRCSRARLHGRHDHRWCQLRPSLSSAHRRPRRVQAIDRHHGLLVDVGGRHRVLTVINWQQGLASFALSLRDSAFTAATLGTSTGFGNVRDGDGIGNFVVWGGAAQIVILLLMVVGGCVGSTSGGIKTYRALIGFKHLSREVRKLRHRQGVFPIKLGRNAVPEDIVASVFAFLILFIGFALVGTLVVAATGTEFLTAASAAVSAMSNMGPALGEAGPTANFTVFTRPARMVLAALMLVGRLEIYAVMLMFASTTRRIRAARRSIDTSLATRSRARARIDHAS